MPIELNDQENIYLRDSDFLRSKRKIIDKLIQLLGEVQADLKALLSNLKFDFPEGCDLISGKISRGENYRGLPYLVLDFPKLIHRERVFLFRTMFWWGHTFSCTLHLQGETLEIYQKNLVEKSSILKNTQSYIGVYHSPWEHHFEADNYRLYDELDQATLVQHLEKKAFVKLSRKLPLVEYSQLTLFAQESLSLYLRLLSK